MLPGGFFQAYNVIGKEAIDLLRHGSHVASTGALIRDTSEGRVHASKNKEMQNRL